MADINGLNPETGEPISVPQEAAAQAYKEGRLKFKPGDRVPVIANGQSGTILASDLDDALGQGLVELNFDPHGDAKAFGASALSSATLGATDWLAVEGSRLLHGDEGAEKMKESLRALRADHPKATTTGDLTGAGATLFIPGEEEVGAAKLAEAAGAIPEAVDGAIDAAKLGEATGVGAREVSAAGQAATPEMAQEAFNQAGQLQKQVAQTQALSGATRGSLLARTLRATNPYTYVGAIGGEAESALARLLGDGIAGKVAPGVARVATEGALIGLADSADEDELGEPGLTAEAYLASAEHGALWGSALGLVGAGATRILTGAGRMAGKLSDRLAEAHLGGSPNELGRSAQRFGRGSLGHFMLENGWSPLMSMEQQYRWAESVKEKVGMDLGRVLNDHGAQADVSAKELLASLDPAIDEAERRYVIAGGQTGLGNALKKEAREAIGWKSPPGAPEPILPHQEEEIYQALVKERGLPEVPKPPKLITEREIRSVARGEFMRNYTHYNPGPNEIRQMWEQLLDSAKRAHVAAVAQFGEHSLEAEQAFREIGEVMNNPISPKQARKVGLDRREAFIKSLRDEGMSAYGQERAQYENIRNQHEALRRAAKEQVAKLADERIRDHLHSIAAAEVHNENLRVDPRVAKPIREKWDKLIPWNYVHNPDSVAQAAAEIKLSARSSLEDTIESGFDRLARETKDPEILGRYLHAKQRYAMATDIARMASRGERRAAGLLGRPSRVGGLQWHFGSGLMAAATGHPLSGALAIAGGALVRRYGGPVTAYALHKAAKMAELKALKQEYLIGHRRGLRAALEGNLTSTYSRVKLPDLPPHELRQTAAEAMAHVYRMAGNTAELRSRLASYDPALPLVAPKTFLATEGAMRRAMTYLAVSIPPKLSQAMARGEQPTPRDLTDHEARQFLTTAATVIDPRFGSDALAKNQLTTTIAKAMKLSAPGTVAFQNANLKRMAMNDRARLDYLPPMLKSQLRMLGPNPDPAFAAALQSSASMMNAQNSTVGPANAKGSPTGMAHASATSKGMAPMVGLSATMAQAAEAGPPGQRGRKASSAEDTGL